MEINIDSAINLTQGFCPKTKVMNILCLLKNYIRRVSAKNPTVEYIREQKSKAYYIAMIGAIIFFLGIAITLIIYGRHAVFIGLIIAIAWLIWLIWTLIKNRPVKYNPLDIPSRLLPK